MEYKVTLRPASGSTPPGSNSNGSTSNGAQKPRQSSRATGRRRDSSGPSSVLGMGGGNWDGGASVGKESMSPAFLARMSPNVTASTLTPPSTNTPLSTSSLSLSPQYRSESPGLGPGGYMQRSPSPQPGSASITPNPSPIPFRGSHFIPQSTAFPTRALSPNPYHYPQREAVAPPAVPAKEGIVWNSRLDEKAMQASTSGDSITSASRTAPPPPSRELPPQPSTETPPPSAKASTSARTLASSERSPSGTVTDDKVGKPFRTPVRPKGHVNGGSHGSGKIVSPPPPPPSDMPLPPLPTRMPSGTSVSSLGKGLPSAPQWAPLTPNRDREASKGSLKSMVSSQRQAGSDRSLSLGVAANREREGQRQLSSSSLGSQVVQPHEPEAIFGLGLGPVRGLGEPSTKQNSRESRGQSSLQVASRSQAKTPSARTLEVDKAETSPTVSIKSSGIVVPAKTVPEGFDSQSQDVPRADSSRSSDTLAPVTTDHRPSESPSINHPGSSNQAQRRPSLPPPVERVPMAKYGDVGRVQSMFQNQRSVSEGQPPAAPGSWPSTQGRKGSKAPSPTMEGNDYGFMRRSEDVSRSSIMWAMESDQQRKGSPKPDQPPVQSRKSSGGLRNLFSRGKGKEKEKDRQGSESPSLTPPMPKRRASEDLLRPKMSALFGSPKERSKTPESPLLTPTTEQRWGPSVSPRPSPKVMESSPLAVSQQPPQSITPQARASSDWVRESTPTPTPTPQLVEESPPSPPLADQTSPSAHSDETFERTVRPSPSLHLLELPQLNLSIGSPFDDFSGSASTSLRGSPRSPKRASAAARRRSRSFSGVSSGSMPQIPTDRSGSVKASGSDKALHILDGVAPQKPLPDPTSSTPISLPPFSSFEHGRSFSAASSSMADSSPPRTPGSGESIAPAIGTASQAGSTTDLSESCASDKSTAISTVTIAKTMRPRQLQLSDLQNPPTIVEVEEAKEASAGLAPAAEITAVAENPREPSKVVMKSRLPSLLTRSRSVSSKLTQSGLADEMRRILNLFRAASSVKNTDKATLIRGTLLDTLLIGERGGFDPQEKAGNAAVRSVCVEWVNVLLQELRVEQAANERGACLEALSAVLENNCLSERALEGHRADQAMFRSLMVKTMTYVMSKLSGKGVFHNTLLFAGRMLAFAFFRVEGIAQQLLAALPSKPAALARFVFSAKIHPSCISGPDISVEYPAHLSTLVFDNAKAYTARLTAFKAEYKRPDEAEAFIFRPGNWLRRWQSDDSELFGAFYRAYHRQLSQYLGPAIMFYEREDQPIGVRTLLEAPGYAHLASVYATKCHSYIVNSVNAVTTVSTASHFDANESAGQRGNVKPPVLETANRRLAETILNLTNARHYVPLEGPKEMIECEGPQMWCMIVDVWVKNLISRTSLYSPKSLFCLFDLLDGVIEYAETPSSPRMGEPEVVPPMMTLLDVPHMISVVRLILTQTDHHLTLAKTIAFVWTHFDTLCAKVEDREELCIKLLLEPEVFNRLLLFWSQSVRSYVLRLVVFRLGHVATSKSDVVNHEMEVATVQLLNDRLERIRRRHDELEPRPLPDVLEQPEGNASLSVNSTGALTKSRSTITMVESSAAPDAHSTKAERLLGLAPLSPNLDSERPEMIHPRALGKATSWLKKSFGKQKKPKGGVEGESDLGDSRGPRASLDGDSLKILTPPVKRSVSPRPGSPLNRSGETDAGTSPDSAGSFEGELPALHPRGVPTVVAPATPSPAEKDARAKTPTAPKSPTQFAFEFELKTASPRSDTFDRGPSPASPGSPAASATPPRLPASPHMSRSFSRRSSLLHPVAATILDGPASPSYRRSLARMPEPPAYDKRLHPYCIRMLAELEDVQKEYEEWWSEGGMGRMDNSPPRLNVAWPFSDEED